MDELIGSQDPKSPVKAPSFRDLAPASEAASRVKGRNRKTDTVPELLLRVAAWRLGLRFRKNVRTLPGSPDLVFVRAKVAVFCDGDFWHGRDWERRRERLALGHNAAYWTAKIARNRERDQESTAALQSAGWLVLRFWESDVKRDAAGVALAVRMAVAARTAARSRVQSGNVPG